VNVQIEDHVICTSMTPIGYKLIGVRAKLLKPTNPKAANQHLYLSPSPQQGRGFCGRGGRAHKGNETVKPGDT
jgi:hypothetical protein